MAIVLVRKACARAVLRRVDLIEPDVVKYTRGAVCIVCSRRRFVLFLRRQDQFALHRIHIGITVVLPPDVRRCRDEKIRLGDRAFARKRRMRSIPFLSRIRRATVRRMVENIVRLHTSNLRRIENLVVCNAGIAILISARRDIGRIIQTVILRGKSRVLLSAIAKTEERISAGRSLEDQFRRSVVGLRGHFRVLGVAAEAHIHLARLDVADAVLLEGDVIVIAVHRVLSCCRIPIVPVAKLVIPCGISEKLDRIFDAIGSGT